MLRAEGGSNGRAEKAAKAGVCVQPRRADWRRNSRIGRVCYGGSRGRTRVGFLAAKILFSAAGKEDRLSTGSDEHGFYQRLGSYIRRASKAVRDGLLGSRCQLEF
jgi:hypothetical protein